MKAVNIDELKSLPKDAIAKSAKHLSAGDIDFLVQTLTEKDDTTRYNAFLLLQANSPEFPYVYRYWKELDNKMRMRQLLSTKFRFYAYRPKRKMG